MLQDNLINVWLSYNSTIFYIFLGLSLKLDVYDGGMKYVSFVKTEGTDIFFLIFNSYRVEIPIGVILFLYTGATLWGLTEQSTG